MEFIADLHIHSRFSRATSKNFDLENMYITAQMKGITVVGTGDFTHPGWFLEIKEKLVPAEQGLFKLKDKIAEKCNKKVPLSCRGKVRFILVSEISNIYKKNQKTRKNHNIVFMPDLDRAEQFNLKLDKIGNIKSDGRPILGLDARNLLEILLETSEHAFLIPAHIWTPWFSLLGSKSGFDSVKECFEDLTPHIFAVETGLSSDPAMNWRVSGLDGLTLVSNSDAHSPLKMGREANLLNTDLSYTAIKSAIKTGNPEHFLGTLEFYPQEGKYHLDGHRKCNLRLRPQETKSLNGKCPVCDKPLTLGVLYRVEELADRLEGIKPEKHHPFFNIIPLTEILSEIFNVGSQTKKVMANYQILLDKLGPELKILTTVHTDVIHKIGAPLLGEAIARMRRNEIIAFPGYDGEFGKIKIFNSDERDKLLAQKKLFVMPTPTPAVEKKTGFKKTSCLKKEQSKILSLSTLNNENNRLKKNNINPQQRRAVEYQQGPLVIIAGPGTGKTRTLIHRIAHLLTVKKVLPQNILAVTFTNKAAQEMQNRLAPLVPNLNKLPFVGTFHSFCYQLLTDYYKIKNTIINAADRLFLISEAIKLVEQEGLCVDLKPKQILDRIISTKQQIKHPDDTDDVKGLKKNIFSAVYHTYQDLLSVEGLYDYEDLILKTVRLFESDPQFTKQHRDLYRFVFIDEYQDLNYGQYCIVKALVPPGKSGRNICVIGDPQQSIYGFRGSDCKYFSKFINDYPEAEIINLVRNYRSTQTIINAALQVVNTPSNNNTVSRVYSETKGVKTVTILESASEKAEAIAVGRTIEQLIGGTGFHSIDFGTVDEANQNERRSFSDFAVLYRTADQSRIFCRVFDTAGIPYQVVSRENLFSAQGVPEIISLLKIVEEAGCVADLARIVKTVKPAISKPSIEIFNTWCYQNKLTVQTALNKARRFPIPKMGSARQTKLNDFLTYLNDLKKQTKGTNLEQKLLLFVEKSGLSEAVNSDPKTKQAINRLVDISRTCHNDPLEFFVKTALQTDTDTYVPNIEKVALMTMHAAKGLEFPVVFVVGCEKGLLPFQRPNSDAIDAQEEKRLFYVAMTRAKERLYLSYAQKRRIYGKTKKQTPSPFLSAIEEDLKTLEKTTPGRQKEKRPSQLKLF